MLLSLWAVWLSCLECWAQALDGSHGGELLIFHQPNQHHQKSSTQRTITADAARLILACRFGVDQFHDLSTTSAGTYDAINDFAGGRGFLGDAALDHPPVALLHLDGLPHLRTDKLPAHSVLALSETPSTESTNELLLSLAMQVMALDGVIADDTASALTAGAALTSKSSLIRKLDSTHNIDLPDLITSLLNNDYDVLVLATPLTRESSVTYGTWTRPASYSKRQNDEEPLEPSSTFTSQPSSSPSDDYDQSKPLRGILPVCYTSLSACMSTTRNCTGHGSCQLRYSDKSAGTSCYACACNADVRTNADGTTFTTYFGGPACQKKDIVVPFWLLAGFSVTMMSLVTWGIGTIWSMGDEQLPSVIGAGVGGVPRRN